jgi:hypothetical protein
MIDLIKEQKELFKNQIIDYINDEIDNMNIQIKDSIESHDTVDENYFTGKKEGLLYVKEYIKNM